MKFNSLSNSLLSVVVTVPLRFICSKLPHLPGSRCIWIYLVPESAKKYNLTGEYSDQAFLLYARILAACQPKQRLANSYMCVFVCVSLYLSVLPPNRNDSHSYCCWLSAGKYGGVVYSHASWLSWFNHRSMPVIYFAKTCYSRMVRREIRVHAFFKSMLFWDIKIKMSIKLHLKKCLVF